MAEVFVCLLGSLNKRPVSNLIPHLQQNCISGWIRVQYHYNLEVTILSITKLQTQQTVVFSETEEKGIILFVFVFPWPYVKPAQSRNVEPVEHVQRINNNDTNPVCFSLCVSLLLLSPGRSDSDLPDSLWGPSVSPETCSVCSQRLSQARLLLHSMCSCTDLQMSS